MARWGGGGGDYLREAINRGTAIIGGNMVVVIFCKSTQEVCKKHCVLKITMHSYNEQDTLHVLLFPL